MEKEWKVRLFQFIRLLFIVVIIIFATWFIKKVFPLLYPFVIGFLIAYLTRRPTDLLEKRTKIPRWLAVTIVLLLTLSLIAGLVTILLTQIIVEIGHLITVMPLYIQEATDYTKNLITHEIVANFYDRLQFLYSSLDDSYKTKVDENIGLVLSRIAKAGTYLINSILGGLQAFLLSLPNAATVFVISVLAAFFISKDYYEIRRKVLHLLPSFVKSSMSRVAVDLKKALIGFIRAQLTLITITAVLVIIGLLILHVEYAFSIGFLTGLADLLPVFGTGSVFIPWIAYLFIKGDYSLVIGLAVLFGFVVIVRQIIEPKIVAESIGLDPLVTLIALFIGLQLAGVAGLILGPISVIILKALLNAGVFRDLWAFILGNKT
jgi:sporulation integral membrane protein YtvI